MNLIVFIALFLFFYKFAPKCVKEGDKFFKEYTPTGLTQLKKTTKVATSPFKGYFKAKGYLKDDFGMFNSIKGSPDLYMDKSGQKYLQGPFTGDNVYFASPSTVIMADIEHMGMTEWYGPYGCYEAYMVRSTKTDQLEPMGNYFRYIPQHCPICGEFINYRPNATDILNGSGPVETSVLSDSHARYCPSCNEILHHNTETYYPFFIDTLNHKLITSQNKRAFTKYMEEVSDMRSIRKWIKEADDQNRLDWVHFDETLLTKEQLSEYTKNEHVVDMWHRLKVCK